MIVAIDGPAGTGKSTIAAMVSKKTNLRYINSGNIYRAFTFMLYNHFGKKILSILKNNPEKIARKVRSFSLALEDEKILLNGTYIKNEDIRSSAVETHVAAVSSLPMLRYWINTVLRRISQTDNIIVEGRDMSTAVFPEAELKIYLDADLEIRALRRYKQGNTALNLKEIKKNIEERDRIDREKAVGSLKHAPDAKHIDTTGLTIAQVYAIVIELIEDIKAGS